MVIGHSNVTKRSQLGARRPSARFRNRGAITTTSRPPRRNHDRRWAVLIVYPTPTRLSTIRRGLEGLVTKFSIERENRSNGNGTRDHAAAYRVFTPDQIIARREERGVKSYAKGIDSGVGNRAFERVIQRVVENKNLSRREAQVALCCVEGLTNAEIGSRLLVSEQTVKFHLRHIFIKFGVKRRAELISRLLL